MSHFPSRCSPVAPEAATLSVYPAGDDTVPVAWAGGVAPRRVRLGAAIAAIAAVALVTGAVPAVGQTWGQPQQVKAHPTIYTGTKPSYRKETRQSVKDSVQKVLSFTPRTGATGARGEKGDKGIKGLRGLKGDDGPKGYQGYDGQKGLKGDDGPPGDPG